MRNSNGTFAKGSKHLVKHGMAKSQVYNVWSCMKSRCQNPNDSAYANYGGRGITVCDQWQEFARFYEDMGNPPDGHSLDRLNNDGPYSPTNCRWATPQEQSRNRRHVRKLTIDRETRIVAEWSEISGIKSATIRARIKKGWPVKDAVFHPLITRREGISRGEKLYGDRHGVQWTDERQEAA